MRPATSAGTAVPPDWYPDPAGVGQHRYWDGQAWTPGVVIDGRVTESPLPPLAAGAPLPSRSSPSAELPPEAIWVALGGFIGGVVLAVLLVVGAHVAGLPAIVLLIAGMLSLWTGLVGACAVVSHRYGTGSLREDFGLRLGWLDVSWGLLASVAARVIGVVFAIPFILAGQDDTAPQAGLFEGLELDVLTVVVVAFVALIGAPVVEELFFRGLLQRALLPRIGVAGAVGVQAFLFAVVHLSPVLGMRNLVVLAVILPAGVVLGLAARWRGLGTSMVAHSLFNVVAVVVTLAAAA